MWTPQLNVKLPCLANLAQKKFITFSREYVSSWSLVMISVTGLGNLMYFGQPFKAAGNNYFAQIAHILGNIWKCYKIFKSSSEISFGQLLYIDIWQLFTGHAVGDDANTAKKFRHLRRSEFLQKI